MGRFNAAFFEKNKANQNSSPQSTDNNTVQSNENDNNTSSVELLANTGTEANTPENIAPVVDSVVSENNHQHDNGTSNSQLPANDKVFRRLDVDCIEFAEDNPFRKNDKTEFGQEELEELANNIAVFGLLHPLLVNEFNGHYVLISGERRLKAVKMLGWDKVDCIVTEVTDAMLEKGMLRSANTEVRRTIKPFEMFGYIYELLNIYKALSAETQTKSVGKDKYQYVANSLSISKRQLFKYTNIMKNMDVLTSEEKEQLENGDLSINKAYEIIKARNNGSETIQDKKEVSITDVPEDKESSNNDISDNDVTSDNAETSGEGDNVISSNLDADDKNSPDFGEESINDEATTTIASKNESALRKEGKAFSLEENHQMVLESLLNPPSEDESQIYTGISLVTNKKIFGIPFYFNDKEYIIFPSRIVSNYVADDKVVNIKFTLYEVEKGSLRKREDEIEN